MEEEPDQVNKAGLSVLHDPDNVFCVHNHIITDEWSGRCLEEVVVRSSDVEALSVIPNMSRSLCSATPTCMHIYSIVAKLI